VCFIWSPLAIPPRWTIAAYGGHEPVDNAVTFGHEVASLPYLRVLIHLHFVLEKLCISWDRLVEAEEDLVEAETTERLLGL